MSNCVVRSRGSRLPGDVVAQHGVEGCDHLAHDGDDDDFGLFVGGGETMVKDFESRIVSAGAQSCHVEHVTDWQPTTVDAAMSFEPAAVEVIRGETDQGGGGPMGVPRLRLRALWLRLRRVWRRSALRLRGRLRSSSHGGNDRHYRDTWFGLLSASGGVGVFITTRPAIGAGAMDVPAIGVATDTAGARESRQPRLFRRLFLLNAHVVA